MCGGDREIGRPLVKVTQALTKSLGALGQSWDLKVMFYYNKIYIEIKGIYITYIKTKLYIIYSYI